MVLGLRPWTPSSVLRASQISTGKTLDKATWMIAAFRAIEEYSCDGAVVLKHEIYITSSNTQATSMQDDRKGHRGTYRQHWGDEPDLGAFFLNSVQNGPKGRFLETAGDSGFLLIFVSRAKPLGSVVEGVAKWFMNTL